MINAKPKRPAEELKAGEDFRRTMVPDATTPDGAPLWHGWVIMDAFLAGIDWARAQEQKRTADKLADLRTAYGEPKD